MTESAPVLRTAFHYFQPITTRWMDNDVYGHVNNVVYYAYFDTVINRYLIAEGGLDIHAGAKSAEGASIGLCVESHCRYAKPIAFPDDVDAGVAVAHLGRSSVRYEIGIFAKGDAEASASGWFVHVFVDARTRKSVPIPDPLRAALQKIVRH
jgi:acyl-CoA thioester hydrolase